MGILKVGVGALKSVLEDSWREYFYCPAMNRMSLSKKGKTESQIEAITQKTVTT